MLPVALRPLRHRNFALVWTAALISNAGSWMQAVALGVLVTTSTHRPVWTALVAGAAFLPMGLLAPLGGEVADRIDRRRWLIITTFAEMAVAAGLSVLAGFDAATPWAVSILALAGGCASAIGFPAYQAMLPDLVGEADLLAAVSLSSAQFNIGRVIGPALAGIVLAFGSYTLAFACNAASFAAVVVALAFLRLAPTETVVASTKRPQVLRGAWGRMADGARVGFSVPQCRSSILLIGIIAATGSPFIALVPAMAIEVFHGGAQATSALVTAQGIGAVVGALVLGSLSRRAKRGSIVVVAVLSMPVVLLAYGLAPTLIVATFAIAVVGVAYISVLSGLNTVLQLGAPAGVRGRIVGLYMFSLGTVYPLGALLQGVLADVLGVRAVTVGGAVVLALALGTIAVTRPDLIGAVRNAGKAPPAGPSRGGEDTR
ncbi:MAG: MFS transporter [Acidimicrobiales bacterium]